MKLSPNIPFDDIITYLSHSFIMHINNKLLHKEEICEIYTYTLQ